MRLPHLVLGVILLVGCASSSPEDENKVHQNTAAEIDEDESQNDEYSIHHIARVIRQVRFPGQSTGTRPARLLPTVVAQGGSRNSLSGSAIKQACDRAREEVNQMRALERRLASINMVLPRGTPAMNHLRVYRISDRVKRQAPHALAIAMASRNMMNAASTRTVQDAINLRNVPVSSSILAESCPTMPTCNNPNSKYRTADGSCNNPRIPHWGQAGTPLNRILPPTYDDGVMEPRSRATDGSPLPNPRSTTNNVLIDVDNPDDTLTSSVMQWAQFMDHEFAHSPFPDMENGQAIDCCPSGQFAPPNQRHPRCFPVNVTGDPFYAPRGQSCMNVVRSILAVGPGTDCAFGFSEQVNMLTHWIDGSTVYGSSLDEQRLLRSGRNGMLRTSGNNMLPITDMPAGDCEAEERGAECFLAGESRVNEQPGLTAIHTVWLREHNRVARGLQTVNPGWNDETVFQEARRIIIGEITHINYNEWLPLIIGQDFMRSFGLQPISSGFSSDYNPNINPTLNNEFSTAAFRFGHTLVQGLLKLFTANKQTNTILLRDHFNSAHLMQMNPQVYDMLVRSFIQLPQQTYDSFITQELSNHLFQTPRFNFGMDLMSLNVQRGRDHGIATYNDMREICGLPKARNFEDIKDQIPGQVVDRLARVYRSVDDIDLFVGGIVERPVNRNTLLGWTFLCIVGDQFARLKKADRYFYDLGNQPGSFTLPQLDEIRKSSWARILCDNSDLSSSGIQPRAFVQVSNGNQRVPCNSPQIRSLNFQAWQAGSARG